jgi:cell fate (sporulation/competence/biofilm development) regulator YlbF (YheA/YmcA/DUF963 family)
MTNEEIIKLAFELGMAISQSDEIGTLKAKQFELTQNPEAYDLILRFQDAQTKMEHKSQDGILITPSEENHLSILEQQLNNNPLVKELMQAQESFDNLMQGVYFAMNQAISGGSCSSGCESCGGGCNM